MAMHVRRFVKENRYHCDIVDTSPPGPRVIAGYSYPLPVRHGQVDDLPKMPKEERALCMIRHHRSNTTVNGVCLECLTATTKHR